MAPAQRSATSSSLMVRLDQDSKDILTQAAAERGISVSDYVRQVTISQARKEVAASAKQTISMTPDEQLAFWKALNAPVKLTPVQKRLAKLMRGEE
jgi:uncharacterized protein (DUF1778 family)